MFALKNVFRSDGAVVRSTFLFVQKARVWIPIPTSGSSQLPEAPVLGDLTPSSPQAHTHTEK